MQSLNTSQSPENAQRVIFVHMDIPTRDITGESGGWREMLGNAVSGPDMPTGLRNSRQLWLHAQDQVSQEVQHDGGGLIRQLPSCLARMGNTNWTRGHLNEKE